MLFKRKKEVEIIELKVNEAYQTDRRDESKDRRSFGLPTDFPFIDSKKKVIHQDRRARPERRLNNIVVTETRIKFDAGFLKTQTQT